MLLINSVVDAGDDGICMKGGTGASGVKAGPCEDILIQINAVKSAIHKVGQIVLVGHVNHCVKDGISHGDADKTIEAFTKVLDQFSKI